MKLSSQHVCPNLFSSYLFFACLPLSDEIAELLDSGAHLWQDERRINAVITVHKHNAQGGRNEGAATPKSHVIANQDVVDMSGD